MASSRQGTRAHSPWEKPAVPLPTRGLATNRMWKQDAFASAPGTWLDLDFLANAQTSSAVLTESGLFLRRARDHTTCGSPVLTSKKGRAQRAPACHTGGAHVATKRADPVLWGFHQGMTPEPLSSPVPEMNFLRKSQEVPLRKELAKRRISDTSQGGWMQSNQKLDSKFHSLMEL